MAVAVIGFLPALSAAHPPGSYDLNTITAEYSVRQGVVTPAYSSGFGNAVAGIPVTAELSSFQAVMVYNESTIQPQPKVDYWLLL